MTEYRCRVCSHELFGEPLLHYEKMPGAAQLLPDAESKAFDRGWTLEVFQCAGCGLVQIGSEPVPYYREVIRASAFSEEMRSFRIRQFQHFIEEFSIQGRKVIEIGCGCGEYLSLLKQSGADAYGIEYAEDSVRHCVRNGLNTEQGFIESPDFIIKQGPFNAFFILSFLEHLPEPNSVLRGIAHNLTDDAVGLVEVPNFEMIIRKHLFSEFIRDHLMYFTRDTLAGTLEMNGFEVIECREEWHDYILSARVRKRQKMNLGAFHAAQALLKKQIDTYLSKRDNRKVAIWGAGHQSFALIAMLDLAGRIRYVIDSAPFKQGRYTPATHIPIVSPDGINSDPVESIIVMAAAYSDEVVRIIKERFGMTIGISVVRDYGLEIIAEGIHD